MTGLVILPYDLAKHAGFMFAPVRAQARRKWRRYAGRTGQSYAEQVRKEIQLGRARVVVDAKDPDTLVACAVVRRDAIVWAFTRPGCRRQGVMRWLLGTLGFDLRSPIGIVLWTPTAERIARTTPLFPL